ncbi:MAG: class I SAM-dependent methyltransferase [Anaerolineales bacterium]|nr:class I SAM-dependent methyltransferase [Anaerolineales bacterium]
MYSFTRYLTAKKTVDDRALNRHVWDKMVEQLPKRPFSILEVGAGIGTMIERFNEHRLLQNVRYTAIDSEPANIDAAQQRLAPLAAHVDLALETIDLFDFIRREQGQRTWDLLIAHAFLDLMDVPAALPQLFSLLPSGGHFYFTINFDGATILQPTIDADFDALVEQLYHRTMDERITDGKRSGDSRSGRHLFAQLTAAGASVIAAGSSDWVVFAGENGYPADEAYFLRFIVQTMAQALADHPELDQARFDAWINRRHQQIDAGELVYVAHQLDFFGAIR